VSLGALSDDTPKNNPPKGVHGVLNEEIRVVHSRNPHVSDILSNIRHTILNEALSAEGSEM